jgi:hypothetical protein
MAEPSKPFRQAVAPPRIRIKPVPKRTPAGHENTATARHALGGRVDEEKAHA